MPIIESTFGVTLTHKAIEPHLSKARLGVQAGNAAKVAAIQAEVLSNEKRYVDRYLDFLDKEIEAWNKLLETGVQVFPKRDNEVEPREITINDIKDRAAASQNLLKCINSVLDFVKPQPESGAKAKFEWLKE